MRTRSLIVAAAAVATLAAAPAAQAVEFGSQDQWGLIQAPQMRAQTLDTINRMGGSRVRLIVEPNELGQAVDAACYAKSRGFGVSVTFWNGFDGFGGWYWPWVDGAIRRLAPCADWYSPWNEPDLGRSFAGYSKPGPKVVRWQRVKRVRWTKAGHGLFRRHVVRVRERTTYRLRWRKAKVWRYKRVRGALYRRIRASDRIAVVRVRRFPTKLYVSRADRYRPELRRFYVLAKSIDPSASVAAGDVSPVNPNGEGGASFLRELLLESGGARADSIAFHPYQTDRMPSQPSPAGADGIGDLAAYAQVARTARVAMDITELGLVTHIAGQDTRYGISASVSPPAWQAEWWRQTVAQARAYGVRQLVQYRLYENDPVFPTGVVTPDGNPSPFFAGISDSFR